jgi:hypothetical protein
MSQLIHSIDRIRHVPVNSDVFSRVTRAALLLLLVCRVAFADLAAGRPRPSNHLAWGPFSVDTAQKGDGTLRLTIRDRAKRLLYEVSDAHIDADLIEITGRGDYELRVITYVGGSCCSGVEHFFTYEGGFRHLFTVDRGHGVGLRSVRDLDGDGRPEILFDTEVWVEMPCSSNPECRVERVVVVGWQGGRYRDRTRDFPGWSREQAREYRKLVVADDSHRANPIVGYYVNAVLSGDEASALRLIRSLRLEGYQDEARRWFFANAAALRRQFLADATSPE